MHAAVRVMLVSVLLAVGVTAAAAADKVTTVPVHFAKGASSANLKGAFSGYDTVHYTVGARAGQVMTVKITGSSNANFNILPVGAIPGQTSAIGNGYVGGDWSETLPASGTYVIEVYQMRASARRGEKVSYTIHIGITGGAHHNAGSAAHGTPQRPAGRGYDASGDVPCARYAGQPMGQCAMTVSRGQGGSATVSVSHPDGLTRAIFFNNGKAVGADQSQADGDMKFTASKESDLFFVRVGKERYEIPEVVVFGD